MAKFRMKRGVGGHRMRDGRELGPGDMVECSAEDLGGAIDKFEIIEADPHPEDEEPTEKLIIRNRPNSNMWFDVINTATGEPINTKALKKVEALALIEEQLAAEGGSGGDGDGDSDSSSSDGGSDSSDEK